MKPIVVTTRIRRPPDEVFAFLDVLANHERFTDHFLVDWSLSGPPAGVGAKARMRSRPGRANDWATMEVVEVVVPSLIVERAVSDDGRRRTRGTYSLERAGRDATNVRFELVVEELPVAMRLLVILLRPWLRRANDRAMQRLTELLEGAGPPHSRPIVT